MQRKAHTANVRILLLSVSIVILIFLCFYMKVLEKDLSCEECVIEFKSNLIQDQYTQDLIGEDDMFDAVVKINATELIEAYANKECLVYWDSEGGYKRRWIN